MRLNQILIALLVIFFTSIGFADDRSDAVALVERIRRCAVVVAKGDTAQGTRRENAIARLRASFDTPTIARKVLGTYWQTASSSERSSSIEGLQNAILDAVVRYLGSGNSADFTIIGSRHLSDRDVVVTTHLVRPNGRIANLTWRTHQCQNASCIIDVIVDGTSLTISRRDRFAAQMNSGVPLSEAIAHLYVPHPNSK